MQEVDFSKCPFHSSNERVREEIEEIKRNDTRQESSMKALHKRMDEDSKIRQDTHDMVLEHSMALRTHMEWEEKEAIFRKDAKEKAEKLKKEEKEDQEKKDSTRFAIITSIASVVAIAFIAVSSWLFLTVISNSKDVEVHGEKINHNKNQVTYLKGRIK